MREAHSRHRHAERDREGQAKTEPGLNQPRHSGSARQRHRKTEADRERPPGCQTQGQRARARYSESASPKNEAGSPHRENMGPGWGRQN